jgi:hypothetical protein
VEERYLGANEKYFKYRFGKEARKKELIIKQRKKKGNTNKIYNDIMQHPINAS